MAEYYNDLADVMTAATDEELVRVQQWIESVALRMRGIA